MNEKERKVFNEGYAVGNTLEGECRPPFPRGNAYKKQRKAWVDGWEAGSLQWLNDHKPIS